MKMKTLSAFNIKRKYHLIDCSNIKNFGRFLTDIVYKLQGKYRLNYCPNLAIYDKIILLNGKKLPLPNNKTYHYHTGYAGGLKTRTFEYLKNINIKKFLKNSLKTMLPRNTQRITQLKNIHIFSEVPTRFENILNMPQENQQKVMKEYWRSI